MMTGRIYEILKDDWGLLKGQLVLCTDSATGTILYFTKNGFCTKTVYELFDTDGRCKFLRNVDPYLKGSDTLDLEDEYTPFVEVYLKLLNTSV